MALNRLVRERQDSEGNTIYVMLPEEVEVRVSQNSSLAPSFTYWVNGKEVTDDIRQLRFSPTLPSDYIQDYDQFQAKLYEKEQLAITKMYERMSLMPKNMSTGKQLIWGLFVFLCICLPIFIVFFLKN